MVEASAKFHKVYWHGRGNPLSKLPASSVSKLQTLGWRQIPPPATCLGVLFSWSSRGSQPTASVAIQQLPESFCSILDDKIALYRTLQDAGQVHCLPPTWISSQSFECSTTDEEHHNVLYFLKHRRGCRGQAVYPVRSKRAVMNRLSSFGPSGKDFVIQSAVAPPAKTSEGHTFCVRAHLLLTRDSSRRWRAFLHRKLICLPLPPPHDSNPEVLDRPEHRVFQGRGPAPFVCGSPDYLARTFQIARQLFSAVVHALPEDSDQSYCHVFGLDLMSREDGAVYLLECNAYPAIGNGTMSHVPPNIFDSLVEDVVRLVVLPESDGVSPVQGDFLLVASHPAQD